MPDGAQEGILKGLYKFRPAPNPNGRPRIHLFGSASIMREALQAQDLLAETFDVAADVWSATSYPLLRREALQVERHNRLHPDAAPGTPYITGLLSKEPWPVVAASDYIKALPDMVSRWVPGGMTPLGTDGFGRSDSRDALRRFFEVNAAHIAYAALWRLAQQDQFDKHRLPQAIKTLNIDPTKVNPADT